MQDFRRKIEDAGFRVFGGFAIEAGDEIPVEAGKFALLIGNAGPAMFERYQLACASALQTMDFWTQKTVDALANDINATPLYPFSKPYMPFQKWARRAKAGFASPLGLNIHPEFGMWHGYRAFLVFDHMLELKNKAGSISPCAECSDQPCLAACPVSAFDGIQYDANVCRNFLRGPDSQDCRENGCAARRGCPVGAKYRYSPIQTTFHMDAFIGIGGSDTSGKR